MLKIPTVGVSLAQINLWHHHNLHHHHHIISHSKAGLIGLSKSVAKELSSRNILCNVVAPGFIKTDMTDAMTPEAVAALSAQIPLERFGSPEDIAGVVAFLCSEHASYITGQVIPVDGGMVM